MKNNNYFKFDKYFIYIYPLNESYSYDFLHLYPEKNDVYIIIHNKKNNDNEELLLKIIYEKNIYFKKFTTNTNIYNLGVFEEYEFVENTSKPFFESEVDFYEKFEKFDFGYYAENNNLLNSFDKEYLMNHWFYCGRHNKYFYFKYLLKKYAQTILELNHPKIKYNKENKNTLLFIDNRYDSSFLYILKLFLYSVANDSWNLIIYTTKENVDKYKLDLTKLDVSAQINILAEKINSIEDYNKILRNPNFWNGIKEENVLLFQYDSIALGKFKDDFFKYNYIGARWVENNSEYGNLYIGNGGTSFRKAKIMENICLKYEKLKVKKEYNEDLFICDSLLKEGLHNCTFEVADDFSCENIFNHNSIYGHQIYNSISNDELEQHLKEKLDIMKESSIL
jgi:hypothetical protein